MLRKEKKRKMEQRVPTKELFSTAKNIHNSLAQSINEFLLHIGAKKKIFFF